MSVETIQTLSTTSFILAGVLLGVSVILFFVLRIQDAFGFLTGRTKKKAIERIRKDNERSKENSALSGKDKITSKIVTSSLKNDQKNLEETTLLSQNHNSTRETTLLSQEHNSTRETTLLAPNSQLQNGYTSQDNRTYGITTNLLDLRTDNEVLGIEYEIVFMESTEIIS